MISGFMGGAQGQRVNPLGKRLFQPEKSHIAAVRWTPPFGHSLGNGDLAVGPKDQIRILFSPSFYGLRRSRNYMSAGDDQAVGYHESCSCRPFIRAENSYDTRSQICVHFS